MVKKMTDPVVTGEVHSVVTEEEDGVVTEISMPLAKLEFMPRDSNDPLIVLFSDPDYLGSVADMIGQVVDAQRRLSEGEVPPSARLHMVEEYDPASPVQLFQGIAPEDFLDQGEGEESEGLVD